MTLRVVVGYDGSPIAADAIVAGTRMVPGAQGWIAYLWGPPFASERMRQRLWANARDLDDLMAMVEREGRSEAERITAVGVALALSAGWQAEPLLHRSFGSAGTGIVEAAKSVDADLVIVGARGLGGADAVLGSVSDMVVHYGTRPVMVIPSPLLSAEYEALSHGPVLVGWDGSPGAQAAIEAAARLFRDRHLVAISVDDQTDVPLPAAPHTEATISHDRVRPGRGRPHRAVANGLLAAADDNNAAVIVVGSRGRSAAREIILGSVAMHTLHHSHRPVVVVPSGAR